MLNLDLSGKTALVTGATGQLGRVIIKTLAQCNANVIIHYHKNIDKAMELKADFDKMNIKSYIVNCDITSLDSVIQMREKIEKEFVMPDIIVNNSVIQYQWFDILNQPIEDYESQFKSCVIHNVSMAKAFVPNMIKNNYGRVIGINTECAILSDPTQSAYASAKRGMDGIFRVLAKEVGQYNITVNQVAPGWVISEKDRENLIEGTDYNQKVPMKRRGTDQEIANTVAFLASSLSNFITGAFIPVSGGHCMTAI